MLRKSFLWYLQYLFWGQLILSFICLIFFMEVEMSIPVIEKKSR